MKFFAEKAESTSKEKVSDIKTLLRLARQYIDDNNVRKAQQCCKKVLRQKRQNYMALVLLAKTYGNSNEALLALEKAIELKPNHALAWQGLALYYEGKDEDPARIKLLSIYEKILTFDIEEAYADKTLVKYSELGLLLEQNDTITFYLQYINVQSNNKLIATAKTQLLYLLRSNVKCKREDIPEVIDILKNLNNEDLSEDHIELIILGDLILKINDDFVNAVEDITSLRVFSESLIMKNWMCKLLSKIFMSQNSLFGLDVDKYINILVVPEIENSTYALIFMAVTFYKREMFEEAYQKCTAALKENFDTMEVMEALFLLNCCNMTKNILRTRNLCNILLRKKQLDKNEFKIPVYKILLSCCVIEKDYFESLYYLKKIPVEQVDGNILTEIGKLFLDLRFINDGLWTFLDTTDFCDYFKALLCIKDGNYDEAIAILLTYDKHPIKYYYLGLLYWFVNKHEDSLENYKKATELMPDNHRAFYGLGVVYYGQPDNIEDCQRCFEKSYALHKTDMTVIKILSSIYDRLGLVDLDFDLLQSAFNIPQTREYWVCLKLGRMCLAKGIVDEALVYLQTAVSIQTDDLTVYELLGDIHYNKKEYDQALDAYNQVINRSLDSTMFFKCLNRLGYIYSEKTMYDKAIYIFDSILEADPDNVISLKGLTENRVICALNHVAERRFGEARDEMQSAFNRITTAMSHEIKDLGYWLLFGDVLVYLTRLPTQFTFVTMQTADGEIRKEKNDMYKMAIESYSNIIKFRDSSALFKCALAYFEYYCATGNSILCKTSYNLAVLYSRINPNIWLVWDLLGKICIYLEKNITAYYCFSKALNLCEDSELKIWSDLGTFYLNMDKHRLADYRYVIGRFDRATFAINPGPGHEIFENVFDNPEIYDVPLMDEDDMDEPLFTDRIRDMELNPPQEPDFDSPIESLKIIPNAGEIIEWYLCFEEETAWSSYSLGNLQENKGLFAPALRYYERAYDLASNRMKKKMLSFKGRVLMKMQEYEEAVNVYTGLRNRNFDDTCALATAFYKLANYNRSYATYYTALTHLCESDDQRIYVLVAMANVACRLNGLTEGATLLQRAVRIKYGNDEIDLKFFLTYVFKNVDIQLVTHVLSVYLHKNMDKTRWWFYMGLNYLRGLNKYARLTRACIKRAIRTNTEPQRNGKLYALLGIAEFYAGDRQRALSHALRAMRLYPVQPELWATLILCIYSDNNWPRKAAFLRDVIDTMRRVTNVSDSMNRWLIKIEEEAIVFPRNFNFTHIGNAILL